MLGIMGAMKEEVSSFLAQTQIEVKEKKAGLFFYKGRLSGVEVAIVQCGIGKVNAAMATQILIDEYGVSKIVFTGLAGSGRGDIAIGDYVLGDSLVQHDFDLTSFGREKGMIPCVGRFLHSDEKMNGVLAQVIEDLGKKKPNFGRLHRGVIASGDVFVAGAAQLEQITQDFDALAVEMEGAAVAQVCFLNEIPYAILRTVSDNADENAMADFQGLLDKASVEELEILKVAVTLL